MRTHLSRTGRLATAVATCLALLACAVPHQRDDATATKLAIEEGDVDAVYARYREVFDAAVEIGDAQPLSVVESGSVLAIDSAAFQVEGGAVSPGLRAGEVAIPRFDSYPLWFVAVADGDEGQRRVQVFARASAVDPWTLSESPAIVASTTLPELRVTDDATAVTVAPDDDRGLPFSAQAAVDAYVAALGALPESPDDVVVADDPFRQQMLESYQQSANLADVQFSQSWTAEPVQYVLRTADGGALVFATLHRADAFQVTAGRSVAYAAGTVQNALAPEGIVGSGVVRFDHQVLLVVPPGSGGVRAIGQFGGVVAVDQG